MSIGAGIFLLTLGAILAFGIRDDGGTVDTNVVGVIIMLAGAAGIWLSFYITNRRRRVQTDAIDPVVEEEYRSVETAMAERDAADRDNPDAAPKPATRPHAVHRSRTSEAQVAETRTERHVDLDPAASGLQIPAPDRTASDPSLVDNPGARMRPRADQPRGESTGRRVLNRFRSRH